MRTHEQIIDDAGGYKTLADTLGVPTERARFWERRKSIPINQWPKVAEARIATLEELVKGAHDARAA